MIADDRDPREWRYLRLSIAIIAAIAIVDIAGWKIHDTVHPRPTRLALTLRCLANEKGLQPTAPAGDPLADSAGSGSLRVTVEGSRVNVALASSQKQAIKIAGYYRAVAGGLTGRLERRNRTVYIWEGVATPTQRQTMYDCEY